MTPKAVHGAPGGSNGQPDEDGALRPALNSLEDAIHALTEPRCQQHNGIPRWTDSWYQQLVESCPGDQGQNRSRCSESIVPFWCDAVELRNEIDTAVWAWQRDPGPYDGDLTTQHPPTPETIRRLSLFHRRAWRPQDTKQIERIAKDIRDWATRIQELLDPTPIRVLWDADDSKKWAACPQCGERFIYAADPVDGKPIRKPALQMRSDTMETRCINPQCRHEWGRGTAGVLAGMLGYPVSDNVRDLCEWMGLPPPATMA